tara:strand:+ start:111 stop:254 length:144 start_codon:yes stop_codon:yes gene_type:complete
MIKFFKICFIPDNKRVPRYDNLMFNLATTALDNILNTLQKYKNVGVV